MQIRRNSNRNSAIFLTLIFPFGGLIYSLSHWRESWAKNTFWLACIYMGAVLIYWPEGTLLGETIDGGRYVMELMRMYSNVNSFSEISRTFFDGSTNDLFQPTLTYLVSRFTDNGHVLFFTLAIIYGFFYSRNIWYILEKLPKPIPKGVWVLIAYFFLVCPIWNINGFRMWTALQVFIYGALPYALEGRKSKLIWSLISILVHHSFLIIVVVFSIYFLIPKTSKKSSWLLTTVLVFYILSFTIKTLNLSAIADVLNRYLPEYYESRVDAYTNEDHAEQLKEILGGMSSYVGILDNLKFWALQVFIIFSYVKLLKTNGFCSKFRPLFSFALFLYGFGNITSLIPSGRRYSIVALMLLVPALLLIVSYSKVKPKMQVVFNIAFFFLGISLLFDIRVGLDFYGIMLLFGNFFTAPFVESNVPLIEFIKQLV